MNSPTQLQPTLCIDLKKNRIRIHKGTLHLLGNPEYIQILINPEKQMLALRKSKRTDHAAHRISICSSDSKYYYELYSLTFLQKLRKGNKGLENNQSYRIYGEFSPKEGIAQFSMNDCIPVDDSEKEEVLL